MADISRADRDQMVDPECIRRLSDGLSLGIPDSDLDRLAMQLSAQLDQIRRFDRLDLSDSPPGSCFDVRWKH